MGTNVDGVFACVRCPMGVLLLATGVIVLLFPGVTVLGVFISKVCCWFGVVGSCVARRYALRPAFVGSTVVFCTILSKTCVRPGGVATKSVSALKELFARTKCRLSGLRCPLDGDGVSLALPLAPVCIGDSLVALWTLSSRSPRVVPGVPAFVVRLASAPLVGVGIATFLRPLGFGDCWPDRKNPLALDASPMGARVLMLLLPFKFRGEGLFLPIDNLFRDMLVFAAERTIGVLRRTARVKALAKTVLIVVLAGP